MIALIVGDFGAGKDTAADLIKKESLNHNHCVKFRKIKSYTTRERRYDGENTHLFCTKDEFENFTDLVAETKIGDHYYGARAPQFNPGCVNLYIVDKKGVKDILEADIDSVRVIEVVRPSWLIDVPEDRKNREAPLNDFKIKADYRIINDGDMQKLKTSALDCFNYLVTEFKKSLL